MTIDAKDPDHDTEYEIDARSMATAEMRRDYPYLIGAIAKHPRHTGFYYQCTVAGETKANWPDAFPRADGLTLDDGSVEWTARHPNSSSLPQIEDVEWIVDPAGLSVLSERILGGLVFPLTSGGAAGNEYDVTARITWSNGITDDVTITIPVAQQ